MLFREAGFDVFDTAITDAPACRISAAGFVEVSIIVESRGGDPALRQCDLFFREAQIAIEPVTEEQAHRARQAYSIYGKGRHPAALNFGDCFSRRFGQIHRRTLVVQSRLQHDRYPSGASLTASRL
jgi:ribonuclease VapC